MAPSKRRAGASTSPTPAAPRSSRADASPKPPRAASPSTPPLPTESRVPGVLAALVVLGVAAAAVVLEFTTSADYAGSKPLMRVLKQSFVAFVCLGVRVQLPELAFGAGYERRRPSLTRLAWGHVKSLAMAFAANAAGTTIIRPAFGAAPQYEETFWMVVPTYSLVVLFVDVIGVPLSLVNAVIGLLVSWLKAITIAKLVLQWQESADAHPVAFVAVSTANLFASGVVLRYLVHYQRSRQLVQLSFGVFWSVVKIAIVAGVIGLIAHAANHFMTQRARQLEARVLYFVVAWFALHKYWETPLAKLLSLAFAPAGTTTKKVKRS